VNEALCTKPRSRPETKPTYVLRTEQLGKRQWLDSGLLLSQRLCRSA